MPYHFNDTLIVFIVTRNITTQYIDFDFTIVAILCLNTALRCFIEGKRWRQQREKQFLEPPIWEPVS